MSHTNKFKAYRLARAWSQEQLAELSGLSTRTIQRIESGHQPGLETLSALAAVFAVNVAELTDAEAVGDEARDRRIGDVRNKVAQEGQFYRSTVNAAILCLILLMLNHLTSPHSNWGGWVTGIWSVLLVVRGIRLFVLAGVTERWQRWRMQQILRKSGCGSADSDSPC